MKVDLDALEALEKAATPANWRHDGKATVYVGQYDTPYWETYKCLYSDGKYELDYCADGKLIEAMRNALPAMIEELRALRKLARAFKKAKEERYCNVPIEVHDAVAGYEKLVGGEK